MTTTATTTTVTSQDLHEDNYDQDDQESLGDHQKTTTTLGSSE